MELTALQGSGQGVAVYVRDRKEGWDLLGHCCSPSCESGGVC